MVSICPTATRNSGDLVKMVLSEVSLRQSFYFVLLETEKYLPGHVLRDELLLLI